MNIIDILSQLEFYICSKCQVKLYLSGKWIKISPVLHFLIKECIKNVMEIKCPDCIKEDLKKTDYFSQAVK
jgi:hypothetical protein